MEAYVRKICTRHGIKSEKIGEYVLSVSEILNESSEKAIDSLNKQFDI